MLSHHHARFSGYRHCGGGYIMVLVCQVISEDGVIKGSNALMVRNLSWKSLPWQVWWS